MNEQEVRILLTDLAETPAPPSRVDVPRAATTARRQARVRTWTMTAAASVLVAGLVVGVTYAVGGGTPAPEPVAGAPARFDPLIRYASFGWVPDENKMNSSLTVVNDGRFATSVSEFVPDPAQGPMVRQPAAEVGVSLYAAGVKPESEEPLEIWGPTDPAPTVPYAPVTDAPDVNGVPAYWVTVPGEPERIILKWRWAPDAWAEVDVARIDGDLRQSAHRVASEVRIGDTGRLRFPFHVTGLPAGLRPVSSSLSEGGFDAPWRVDLDFATDEQTVNLRLVASPMSAGDDRVPNTTVDGRPVLRQTAGEESGQGVSVAGSEYFDMLFVDDVSGLRTDVLLHTRTEADAAPLGPDGAAGVFRNLTVHPDRADWTDRPDRPDR
ncbi:MAG: hypothetical protein WBA97_07540 [Actinophytocola sp.]|uniref:hypothetical protein n=1 Tax=Actinophytocola sp. TaxID=1872138 RepID=UPI003C72B84B